MEKKCSKCKVSKPTDQFPNDPRCSEGKRNTCKDCRLNAWVPDENEHITCTKCNETKHHSLLARRGKQRPHECKECRNKTSREKRSSNREEHAKKEREFYQKNKEKINDTRRKNLQKRRDEDVQYRVMMSLHVRLYDAVKHQRGTKSAKTLEMLGSSVENLTKHLESKFAEGMTWENYGIKGWHVDHIRPCASFDLEDPEEQKKCFHWSNLQPLWAADNLKKSDKWQEA